MLKSLGSLLLWIVVPWIISKVLGYLRHRQPRMIPPKRPKTWKDRLVTLVLLLSMATSLYIGIYKYPMDLLDEMDVRLDAPSFIVRNRFRSYMADRYPTWTEGSDLHQFNDQVKHEIRQFERLAEKLKLTENRKHYLHFGHTAFIVCDWCKDSSDYFMFISPKLLSTYTLFLVILGGVTLTWRKGHWRLYGMILLGITASLDLYLLLLQEDTVDEDGNNKSPFQQAFLIRHFMFTLLCLLIWLFDRKHQWLDQEIAQTAMMRLEEVFKRQQVSRLLRAATLSDASLRQFMIKEEEHPLKNAMDKSTGFKELREKILQRHNLGIILEQAKDMVSHLKQFDNEQYSSEWTEETYWNALEKELLNKQE